MKEEMREVRKERSEQSAKRKHIRDENGIILGEQDRIENMKQGFDGCKVKTDHDNAELLKENATLRQVNQDISKELEHARERHQCVTKKYNDLKALSQKGK